ncbi:hypothetical protein F5144DRAFT_402964 [Chaetomium tenue]|uniref:Uncharacterized protein n=1 Tax=Chaetomium tenue TaxID=1854479 RepID=A0ACB7NX61_9PEZI|nr:hypothetical protein F5144DRAFT_402964 [Chaetomium globosum]
MPSENGSRPVLLDLKTHGSQVAEDLCETAAAAVGDDLKDVLEPSRTNRRHVLEGALLEATQKQKQCLEKRWKIKNRKGDVIILRDVFEKIVTCIHSFKGIGDSVANMGPGWAAIPWALVGALLKGVISDNETFATMVEGLEKATRIVSRYSVFEAIYLVNDTAGTAQLRSSLVALYASVLTFLGDSYAYFSKTTTRRFIGAFASDSGVDDLLDDVAVKQGEVDCDALLVATETLQSTAQEIRGLSAHSTSVTWQLTALERHLEQMQQSQVVVSDLHALRDAISTIEHPVQRVVALVPLPTDDLNVLQRKAILDWLSPVAYKIQHISERHRRLPDSGAWMFSSDKFRAWKDSSVSGTLWLHGMPGCGKTKLLSAVVDYELEGKEKDPRSVPLAYFYCSRNTAEPERSNPVDILRCIARQLCSDDLSKPIPEQLRHLHEFLGSPIPGTSNLPLPDTTQLILDFLKENPAIIIIDALDECNPTLRHELFEALDEIVAKSENIVKVFLTSRNDGDITARLASTPNIYINAQRNGSDINRFIGIELDRVVQQKQLLRGQLSHALRDEITATLSDQADGMFRWVTLQIQNLCDTRRMRLEKDVRSELGRLPKTLADLYLVAFNQVLGLGVESSRLAISALQILLVAFRPLSWDEFLYLLVLSDDGPQQSITRDEVVHITCNFIEEDPESDRVGFPHLSAREYLETRPEFDNSALHIAASQLCLRGIKYPEPPGLRTSRILFTYSTLYYLGSHLAKLGVSDRRTVKLLHGFLSNPAEFRQYTGRMKDIVKCAGRIPSSDDSQIPTTVAFLCSDSLAMICLYGLQEFLSWELANHHIHGTNAVHGRPTLLGSVHFASTASRLRGRSYLEICVSLGHVSLLQEMHSLGISFDQCSHDNGMAPLHVACSEGQADMVRVLLELGADVNQMTRPVQRREPAESDRRPLTALGFRLGDSGAPGVSPLAFGSNQELQYPIHLAISGAKSMASVRVLVEFGADSNVRTSNGTTALQLCFEMGDGTEEIVQFLLGRGANPNAQVGMGRTMLHIAAAMGLVWVVPLLLSAGADPTSCDSFGQTPWDNATRYGHDEIADALAEAGGRPMVSQHSLLDNYQEGYPETSETLGDYGNYS